MRPLKDQRPPDIQALEERNQELERQIAAFRQREQVQQALLALQNRELRIFSYSLSHDLRAPLRAISGFAQLLARRHQDQLNDQGRHWVDNICEASAQLEALIGDLLRYIHLGQEGLQLQGVELGQVLEQVSGALAARIAEKGGQLRVAAGLPRVQGDATLLGQVFLNLLDNALTYSQPRIPPAVEVGFRVAEDCAVVCVRDQGIGIPPEFHAKIFGLFQRLHSQEEYPGTGLGLAIVHKAVELMKGRVWVESAPGEGSRFYVELPLGGPPEAQGRG